MAALKAVLWVWKTVLLEADMSVDMSVEKLVALRAEMSVELLVAS